MSTEKRLRNSVLQVTDVMSLKLKNSVAFSPQANYTERPPLVGEVSANFCG
jgi:hypothetical protein